MRFNAATEAMEGCYSTSATASLPGCLEVVVQACDHVDHALDAGIVLVHVEQIVLWTNLSECSPSFAELC
jgi:hypothetical protein